MTGDMVWIDPDYRAFFQPAEVFAQTATLDGEVYKTGHGRVTMRFERGGRGFFLKRHTGVGWREIFKELLQGRLPVVGAENEWRALEYLRALNIPSLRPVVCGRLGRNPARMQSFLITAELTDTVSLEQLVLTWRARPDFVAVKREVIQQTAAIAAALHAGGVNHRDLYLCHLRVCRAWLDNPQGPPPITVVDLHRAQIRGQTPRRWRVKDVAGLLFSSMDAGLTQRDYLRFVKAYRRQPLRDVVRVETDFWRDVRRRAERLYAAHPKPVSVSCVIPTYNYGRYVAKAVDSISQVMRQGDEIIVVDDGSTDDTRQRLRDHIRDGKIRYHYQQNGGPGTARNVGARMSHGDYLYFLDADDQTIKAGFEKLRQTVELNNGIAMVFGHRVNVDRGRRREHKEALAGADREANFVDYLIRRRFLIGQGMALTRRDVALRYPYMDGVKNSADIPFYAWVLANEHVIAIPKPITGVLKHDDSFRNQALDHHYADVVEQLPDIVFDARRIPPTLLKWKRRFYCNLLLELFRAQYRAGKHAAARQTYQRALRCRFLNILQWSYTRKYLRILRVGESSADAR